MIVIYGLFALVLICGAVTRLARQRDRSAGAWGALAVACWVAGQIIARMRVADAAGNDDFLVGVEVLFGLPLAFAFIPYFVLLLLPPGQSLEERLEEGIREMGLRRGPPRSP